jgi:hypothetical protein
MARLFEHGEGAFGIQVKLGNQEEIAWYHTKAGRDDALKAMKETADPKMKFKKVHRMG